jgi:ligand-binding sensor domain-containing protein
MNKRFILSILTAFLCICSTAYGATDNIGFRRFTVHDGLSDSQVNCIYKDSRGYLWVGTSLGLNRFDGFRFKTYFTQAGNANSLLNNDVSDVIEDAIHRMWIRTSYGYCIFDPVTETFDNNPHAWLQTIGVKGSVAHVFGDTKHNLWFDVDNVGCYYYDFATKKTTFIPQGRSRNTLPMGSVTNITETDGTFVVTYNDGTLAKIDVKSRRVMWINRYVPQHGGMGNKGYCTFVDSRHNYWVYTGDACMVYFSARHEWRNLNVMVTTVRQDRNGLVWLATDHNGIIIMDTDGNVLNNFTKSNGDNRSVSDNTLECLFIDEFGTVWVGTYKNGFACHYIGQTTFLTVDLGDVCTICEDNNGLLWCGTNDDGIVRYNPKDGSKTHYNSNDTHLGTDIMVCSMRASDGSLWFGTFLGGLTQYKNGQFKSYRTTNSGIESDNVWTIAEGPDHNIYIGTLGAGLQILNTKTQQFSTFNHANSGLASDYLSSICFDRSGNLLLGHSQGFSFMNIKTRKITNFQYTKSGERLSSPTVNQIFCDSRGLIWVATASGLDVYDRKTDQISVVEVQAKISNTNINSITEDRQGMIWISEANIVSRIKISNKDGKWNFFVNSFSEADGLMNTMFNKRSILSMRNGDIVVGGYEGINIIPKLNVESRKMSTTVLFSGLVLFDHPVSVGEEFNNRVILDKSINESHSLKLAYNENAFTIQLASSDLGVPDRCRFSYRLKGFHDRWMLTTEDQPNVTFTNLASGSYDLEVKAVDYNGNTISPVNTLHISVMPPFYRSFWAYLFYLIVILGASYYARRTLKRRREEAKERAEEEKRRKLDDMKQVFFINVSHELRTPLTLILSPLAGIISQESNEKIKDKLKLINRNALKLLDMINQMLDLRRLMVSAEHLQTKYGDVVEFVHGICDQFLSLSEKHITLTFYSSVSKLDMDFDRDKVGKIVNNLLSNAFKFTRDNGRVDVSLNLQENHIKTENGDDKHREHSRNKGVRQWHRHKR